MGSSILVVVIDEERVSINVLLFGAKVPFISKLPADLLRAAQTAWFNGEFILPFGLRTGRLQRTAIADFYTQCPGEQSHMVNGFNQPISVTFQVRLLLLAMCPLAMCVVAGESANASDHFLTIGGGYEPKGNQISLERNVEFLRSVLATERPDNPPHTILFADGADRHRDLQFRDTEFECPPARRIAMEIFGDVGDIDLSYRNHRVEGVRDATSPRNVQSQLARLATQVKPGERLFIYATAHGGSGDEEEEYNTSIYTWNHRRFTAKQFSGWLDRLPEKSPIVLVMVQCYAGGFAHTMFKEADQTKGLARQLRAGFFAQQHDRPAAGCTPEVTKESYQEYSSFFWAALAGRDRDGANIPKVDYDGDGTTSLAEAHIYALCESNTIDIPMRTSDAYLAYYSSDGTVGESPYTANRKSNEPRRLPSAELIQAQGDFGDLLGVASELDRATITRLAERLELSIRGSLSQVEEAKKRAKDSRRRVSRTAGRARSSHRRGRDRVANEIRKEWPELEADLSPMLAALMAERGEEFVQKVTKMPAYQTLLRLTKTKDRTADELLEAKKREVLVQRLEHSIRRVVLEANLKHVASSEVVGRYQQLLELEMSGLSESAAMTTAASPTGMRAAN